MMNATSVIAFGFLVSGSGLSTGNGQNVPLVILIHFISMLYLCNCDCSEFNMDNEYQVIESKRQNNLTIGFLGSFHGFHKGKEICGAIPMAVAEVNR